MAKTWVWQKPDDVKKLGKDNAPWLAGWYDPDGRRRSKTFDPGDRGRRQAEGHCAKVRAELLAGTYQAKTNVRWDAFVMEYTRRVLDGLEPTTKKEALTALAHFERHMKPKKVSAIDTGTIDDFVARRRRDRGLKAGSAVSPATINKDLRQLRAALNAGVEWGYLPRPPRFRTERTVQKLPRYVNPEHFTAIYNACDAAKYPDGLPYPAGDWWRAVLAFAYTTGWRIGDLLQLTRDCVDLVDGYAVTLGEVNKGDRDARVKLHPAVVEHLRRIPSLDRSVFPWPRCHVVLYRQFTLIQQKAGIHLPCRGQHRHTDACHAYGFHDLRRAFATMNAARLSPEALQQLMRHKAYSTTLIYVNPTRQLDAAVDVIHVPDVLRGGRG